MRCMRAVTTGPVPHTSLERVFQEGSRDTEKHQNLAKRYRRVGGSRAVL